MEASTPVPDRRLDRSPFVDQALEKFLTHLCLEAELFAAALADDDGRLVAASSQSASELELADLGALSVDLRVHLRRWPSLQHPQRFQLQSQSGRRLIMHFFSALEVSLALSLVGDRPVSESLLERAEAGLTRILSSGQR